MLETLLKSPKAFLDWLLNSSLKEKARNRFVQLIGAGWLSNWLGTLGYTPEDLFLTLWDWLLKAVGMFA